MPARFSLAAVGDAMGNLPGLAKIGAVVTAIPVLWALFGIGWAGYKTPGQNDRHFHQMDSIRTEARTANARDSADRAAIIDAIHDGNRLLTCGLTVSGELARARCAAAR